MQLWFLFTPFPLPTPTLTYNVIHTAVASLQTQHLSALIIISGDINHSSMVKTFLNFTQSTHTCPTREERHHGFNVSKC